MADIVFETISEKEMRRNLFEPMTENVQVFTPY
jgi:hypothetical protein